MPVHDIIWSIAALQAIISRVPAALPATILIVQHAHAADPGYLPENLTKAGDLRARPAVKSACGLNAPLLIVRLPGLIVSCRTRLTKQQSGARKRRCRMSHSETFVHGQYDARSEARRVLQIGKTYNDLVALPDGPIKTFTLHAGVSDQLTRSNTVVRMRGDEINDRRKIGCHVSFHRPNG